MYNEENVKLAPNRSHVQQHGCTKASLVQREVARRAGGIDAAKQYVFAFHIGEHERCYRTIPQSKSDQKIRF